MSDIAVERLPTDSFVLKEPPTYEDVFGLHELFEKLAFKSNLILVGPKGIGKTLSIAAFGQKTGTPVVTFDCSEDVRRAQLIGMFIKRGGDTPFIMGPIPSAVEIANEVGKCILCFEEVNALTPQMQKVLNPIADFRKKIEAPECKRVFSLKKGAKLWIVGSMNTSVYGGVYSLNEDLKSRFRLLALEYPPPGAEKKVLKAVLNGTPIDQDVVDKVVLLAHETRQNSMDYALSTRDVVQILEDIAVLDMAQALTIASGKFEGDDRDTMKARVQSIFGIQL